MAKLQAVSQLETLVKEELQSSDVNIAKVSIALGAVETPLTKKDPALRHLPANLLVSRCQTT